jgi:hypothetical protein
MRVAKGKSLTVSDALAVARLRLELQLMAKLEREGVPRRQAMQVVFFETAQPARKGSLAPKGRGGT